MNAIAVDTTLQKVDWSRRATRAEALLQRVSVTLLTRVGSDRVLPTRGADLARRLAGGSAYDVQTVQHELNFAALAARASVRATETSTLPEDLVGDVRFLLDAIESGKVKATLSVTDGAGNSVTYQQPL